MAALGPWLRDPAVNFVATRPGPAGLAVAWAAEFAIAFVLMATVLAVNQLPSAAFTHSCTVADCSFDATSSGIALELRRSTLPLRKRRAS